MNDAAKETRRRYCIASNEDNYIYTGNCDNRQVLIGLLYPALLVVFFGKDGHLEQVQRHELSESSRKSGAAGIFDEQFDLHFLHDLSMLKSELRFRPGIIQVGEFFCHEYEVGLEGPEKYWRPVCVGTKCSNEESNNIRRIIEEWTKSGQFVLWWSNDYFVTRNGRIIAS